MFSEPVRRKAMETSRDLDEAIISGKVNLVQETGKAVQAGFLIYLPIYRNGMSHSTLNERRAIILGWVYSPFRMGDFMEGLFGERAADLDVEIYDGKNILDETKMYDSKTHSRWMDQQLALRKEIDFHGHKWTVLVKSTPQLESRIGFNASSIILIVGIALSILFTLMTWLLVNKRMQTIVIETERRRAEEELINERLLLRTVIDNIPDSIYCKDVSGRKTLANLTELEYSGAKAEADILGKTDFDLYPKKLAEGFFADDQLVVQSGNPILNREEFVLDERGQKQWLVTSKLPLKDEKGNIVGIVGIGRNITSRKLAEEALNESGRFLKETQIIGQLGTYTLDITSGRWVSSDILDSIFGIDADYDKSVEGWESLIHPDWQKIMADYFIKEVIGEKVKFNKEYKIVRMKDKSERWVHGMGELKFNEDNQPIAMIGTIRDITDRKQAEEEIKKQNEKLIKINAEKDKFFSIIAHDLRSPFQGFLSMTEMITENISEFSNEEIVKYIGELNKSAQNIYKLLQNLLDWAQLKKGSFDFTPEEYSLSTIVSANIEQINKRAIQKGITIMTDIPEDQKIFVDERMINSILGNLLSNAVKFTRNGGRVSIKAKTNSDGMVDIAVEDTGVGMSERVVNKLFKIDEKVGQKGTDGELSTGLGLLLCKEFVEKQSGKIWVESEEGKGSIFYFTVPRR